MISNTAFVHPMALCEDSDVGDHSKIWQFASVIRGAVIGDYCTIASGALVDGSRIGDGSIVSQNVAMGPGFVVGPDVFIGPNVVLCNDLWPRAEKAGFAGFIMAKAMANDAMRKNHAAIVIDRGASIGAGAVILPGIILGEDSMVAAGAVVNKNVPAKHLFKQDGSLRAISDALEKTRLDTRSRLAINMRAVL